MTGSVARLSEPQLTLVIGGVRSGKSAFAESLVAQRDAPVLYLATGQVTDDEMAERIRIHRERRPSTWLTLEEPLKLSDALSQALEANTSNPLILLDSVDVWVANLLLEHEGKDTSAIETIALFELEKLLETVRISGTRAVMVSSEAGLSPVSPNRLGRQFQDLLGTVNQKVAFYADAVYLVVAGIPMQIKRK